MKRSAPAKISAFGKRLLTAFHEATNVEIARKLKISEAAVRNYLNGRIPGADMLIRISKETDCSIHWLLLEVGPQKASDLNCKTGAKNAGTQAPLTDQIHQLDHRLSRIEDGQTRLLTILEGEGRSKGTGNAEMKGNLSQLRKKLREQGHTYKTETILRVLRGEQDVDEEVRRIILAAAGLGEESDQSRKTNGASK